MKKNPIPNPRKLSIPKGIIVENPDMDYKVIDFFKEVFRTLNVPYNDACCPNDNRNSSVNKLVNIPIGSEVINIPRSDYAIYGDVPNGVEVYLETSTNVYEQIQVQQIFHGSPFTPLNTDYLEVILPGQTSTKGFLIYS